MTAAGLDPTLITPRSGHVLRWRECLLVASLPDPVTLMTNDLLGRALHRLVNQFQSVRRLLWAVTKPRTKGVHAVAVTPEGTLILVMLSYATGWRLPGGGRKKREGAQEAVLRELREEIGLLSHGEIRRIVDFEHRPDGRHDRSALFLVGDVVYQPRWSLEIKAVREFSPSKLPEDLPAITVRLLAAAGYIR